MIGGSVLIVVFAILAVLYRAATQGKFGPGVKEWAGNLIDWWGN